MVKRGKNAKKKKKKTNSKATLTMPTHYETLGISKSSSQDEIKQAYKKMALKHHPDRNPTNVLEATEKFKLIAEAYSILSEDVSRRIYDDSISPKPAAVVVSHFTSQYSKHVSKCILMHVYIFLSMCVFITLAHKCMI